MLKRVLIGAAAAACLIGSASAAQAQPVGKAPHLGKSPTVTVINLHKAFEKALPTARAGKIAGIVYARGKAPAAAKRHKALGKGKQADCSEPNCPLVYNGGPVQHSPKLYLLLWGPNWSSDASQTASAEYMQSFYGGLGVAPQDDWSTITSQYGDGSGNPTFTGSVLVGTWQDTATPPTGVDQNGLSAEAEAFQSFLGLTDTSNSEIIIATQSGTCPQDFYAPGCNGGSGFYCAWHTSSNDTGIPFTNLPYVIDSGAGCGENSVQNQWDGFSIVGGHEYAETVTDPQPVTGWWDPVDSSGGEIGDKCAWIDLSVLSLTTGNFAVQPLFSNAAFNSTGTGCVTSSQSADTVTVTNPGNQQNAAGTPLSLQMQGTSSDSLALTWSATGLPAGLAIDPSTGLISGTPSTVGSNNVSVTATDTSSASDSVSFTWTITNGGPITSGVAGKCLDDFRDGNQNRNPVNVYTCNGSEAQAWTYSGGMLKIRGRCLDDKGFGGAGTGQILYTCNGQSNQMWTHNASGEYVGFHGLCLTDPNSSTTNNTQVTVDVCHGSANQQWSLPKAPRRSSAQRH
jgi:Ricin-type beta-trefoil lectin domain/Putative Ig domain